MLLLEVSSPESASVSSSSFLQAIRPKSNPIMHSENIDLEGGIQQHEHPSGHKFNYGGNPLAHVPSASSTLAPPFAGYLQPGLYHPPKKSNIGNPVPLGLCGFALTTFVQGLLNFHTRNVSEPSIVLSCGFAYGGLIQVRRPKTRITKSFPK